VPLLELVSGGIAEVAEFSCVIDLAHSFAIGALLLRLIGALVKFTMDVCRAARVRPEVLTFSRPRDARTVAGASIHVPPAIYVDCLSCDVGVKRQH
jgi:hypothetical protein